VGAAVLADDGTVHPGCNVENASYGPTICAERNAVGRAVMEGHRRLAAVLVYTETATPTYPCGACLQVLAEFGRDMHVVLATPGGKMTRTSLPALMPHPFHFDRSPS
jgi:cytidine deaminase